MEYNYKKKKNNKKVEPMIDISEAEAFISEKEKHRQKRQKDKEKKEKNWDDWN